MKQFCNVKLGNGKIIFNEIQILNEIIKEGQKKILFNDLNEYCIYKKNINFLIKRFKKIGFVPNFFIKDDMFFAIKVIRYKFRGHTYETLSCIPLCKSYGKFKKFELK